jgi:hypothetical protein
MPIRQANAPAEEWNGRELGVVASGMASAELDTKAKMF